MPNLLEFDPVQIIGFVVIFARVTGLMLFAPLLGDRNIPPLVKAGMAFILALIFYPVVAAPKISPNPDVLDMALLMTIEVSIGALIGFAARLLLTGVSMAGEVAGFQMGLSIANIFDPTSQTQVALIGQIQTIFALFLLVVMDGHHLLIQAVIASYAEVPPGALDLSRPLFDQMVQMGGAVFLTGLKIGSPLIVALMAANFSIGLMARSVPQVNVIVVGFPFTIALGLMLLALGFPFFIEAVVVLHNKLAETLMTLLRNG